MIGKNIIDLILNRKFNNAEQSILIKLRHLLTHGHLEGTKSEKEALCSTLKSIVKRGLFHSSSIHGDYIQVANNC